MRSMLMARTACTSSLRMIMLNLIVLLLDIMNVHATNLYFEDIDVDVLIHHNKVVQLIQIGKYNTSITMTAVILHPELLKITPVSLQIPASSNSNDRSKTKFDINLFGLKLGTTEVAFQSSPSGFVRKFSFLHVAVMHSKLLKWLSTLMGWIYFAAWSVSFYPQIYINYRRKSVIGLNFDFLALNIVGFTLYSVFNCGMYFFDFIQMEYLKRHPRGIIPVFMNDVFFSMHAAFATIVTICQCFIYVRGKQRVSTGTRSILCMFAGVLIASVGLALGGRIHWLDCIYNCSYIKLCITFIKYVPQAYMNYKRKSTVGWSIGNIILDFIGGFLSVAQKVVNGYNYNDWSSFFGNITKLGIGMFSLSFDIFFMIQHYVLYRDRTDTGTPNALQNTSSKPPGPPKSSPSEKDHEPPRPPQPPTPRSPLSSEVKDANLRP